MEGFTDGLLVYSQHGARGCGKASTRARRQARLPNLSGKSATGAGVLQSELSTGAAWFKDADPEPTILTIPKDVLSIVLGMVDAKTLTAFSLCSRECLAAPTDAHWESLYNTHHAWLIHRKPARLGWREFTQRLDSACSRPDQSGKMIIIGGSWTHHHPLRRLESLADVGERLRSPGHMTALHKVKVEAELREAVSAPGVARDDEGRVIVIGGWSGYHAVTRVERLDSTTGLWEQRPSLLHGRCFLASVTDRDGNHLALGGGTSVWRGATVYDSVEVLRPGDDEWRGFPSMLVARCGHQATVTNSGHVYVAGGYGGGTDYLSSMECFDGERGWQLATSMACSRSGLGFCLGPDQCIYAVGGSQDGVTSTAHSERYDPRRGIWEALAPMPIARGYCAAAFGLTGQLYVSGGQKSFAHPPRLTNNIDIFDTRMGKWFNGPANPGRLDLAMIWSLAF